ncbi:unnamed protein product [Paramecium primaurelia]|uniref:Uncharacterized protein n=1 Tax=Paramecium primaurelia TaxID=5886 RepID=A0A8S1Q7Q6_PARPR|nr:unnamed protein product [Paramecium primaurelia]
MQNTIKTIVQPYNQNLDLEVEQSISIKELFEYIKTFLKINNDAKHWTCYSELECKYLDLNSQIRIVENNRLIINTQPISNSQTGMQTNENQQQFSQQTVYNNNIIQYQQSINNQQITTTQQQFNNKDQQSNKEQQKIDSNQQNSIPNKNDKNQEQLKDHLRILFQILDGNNKRLFSSIYHKSTLLFKLQDEVLQYLGVPKDAATCDFFIYNCIQKPYHYNLTLEQLQLKDNMCLPVRLRWYGGSVY